MYSRICIIGNAGSGKSTLSQALHAITGLPLYHLDQYFWKPGWQEPDRAEFEKIHNELCDRERWIIEGAAIRLAEHRIKRADVIIFLDIPTYVCLYRIFKRALCLLGTVRDTSAPGCPERGPSWKFLQWVWNFNKDRKPMLQELLRTYADQKKIFVVTNNAEMNELIQKLK